MEQFFLMALFALSMSISPGPVNIIALSSGLNHGISRSVGFVSGATIGFSLLLLLIGLGLQNFAEDNEILFDTLTVFGVTLILYFGYKLLKFDGELVGSEIPVPSFFQGFSLQWLNPKAWGACLAAISLFNLEQSRSDLYFFVFLYFFICFIGIGSWSVFGKQAERWLNTKKRRRLFNSLLGILLILLALFLLVQNFR
ncbi:MAG: LysE family translocator [Sneathiellales bacterium]|nr:LysE family translocator [Sneathiellales bacterium]